MSTDDLLKALGERIKRIRRERSITQERLAELADLNLSYMSEIERGQANVSLGIVNAVAAALGISVAELLAGISKGTASEDLLSLFEQVQNLDENKQRMFINAAKGVLSGIQDM